MKSSWRLFFLFVAVAMCTISGFATDKRHDSLVDTQIKDANLECQAVHDALVARYKRAGFNHMPAWFMEHEVLLAEFKQIHNGAAEKLIAAGKDPSNEKKILLDGIKKHIEELKNEMGLEPHGDVI